MSRLIRFALVGWLALGVSPLAAEPAPETAPAKSAVAAVDAPDEPQTSETARQAAAQPEQQAAKAEPAPPAEPSLLININLTTQRMVVTENGKPKYTWAISSGAYGYPTPTGTFNPSWMTQMWYSKQYDNAPMPHSIFFKGGAAIHATSSIHLLGTPASHGCVRLAPSNAAKLYAMVARHGKNRTEITVYGKPKYSASKIARVRPNTPSTRYAYSPYDSDYGYMPYAAPRYVYPGDAPTRYYLQSSRQRAEALKRRRAAARQYYSPY